ncbi:hypothetical protein BWR19_17095 [Halomonas sp. 1513]|nr:hypothetical protein [Halomonas sp. 1513]APX94509.1 hypothetical protein BWR19_17095 [Halomonas sp. 1513]
MAMIPITVEQRDEADRERMEALLVSLSDRLNANFSEQLEQVGHTIALMMAQLDRPNSTTY